MYNVGGFVLIYSGRPLPSGDDTVLRNDGVGIECSKVDEANSMFICPWLVCMLPLTIHKNRRVCFMMICAVLSTLYVKMTN